METGSEDTPRGGHRILGAGKKIDRITLLAREKSRRSQRKGKGVAIKTGCGNDTIERNLQKTVPRIYHFGKDETPGCRAIEFRRKSRQTAGI